MSIVNHIIVNQASWSCPYVVVNKSYKTEFYKDKIQVKTSDKNDLSLKIQLKKEDHEIYTKT